MDDQQIIDEKYMRRCLQLARMGWQNTAPNPMVGAVVVCDGHIIGEGYHMKCGGPHAEVNAINSVKNREQLCRSTIYVSLEPCAHYGKTPPCAQLIIDSKIPRVVVGCKDPFARVNGRGVSMLREAGINVTVGILEQECLWLNRRFITFHTEHRPYIVLKWAQSRDGFIDRIRTSANEPPVQFSSSTTQALVHKLRSECEAICVGHRTWLLDRPSLTVRHWYGRNPLRIVISSKESSVGCDLVATDIMQLMRELYQRNIQSLLVEGGRQTLQSFIDLELWDEARIEIAPIILGKGVNAPQMDGCKGEKMLIDGNQLQLFYKKP